VHKGEKKGLFGNRMPARIQQVVREENLLFLRNRNVYDADYFAFVRNLASKNMSNIGHDCYTKMCLESLQLSVKFLFNTYFHTKSKLRSDLDEWCSLVTSLLQQSKGTCMWMVDYLALDGNMSIKPLLLECSIREIRESFGKLLERTMSSFFQMGGIATSKCFNEIIEVLLAMLQRDVPDHCKQSQQYFQVLLAYVQMGIKACSHMFGRNGFKRLMEFLIGESPASSSSDMETGSRRWSSLQSRDFGALHATLATLILNCDVSHARTEVSISSDSQKTIQQYQPRTVTAQKYLKMSPEMDRFVFGLDCVRYLREVVHALREVTNCSAIDVLEDMLCYLSYNNTRFTLTLIRLIMQQCTVSPCNELKPLFRVLLQVMLLEDELKMRRLKYIIDGRDSESPDERVQGMLAAISHYHTSDSRRSYQIIKFLVNLANKCPMAKDYLLLAATRWQWAVNWLKSKMTDLYWNSQTSASMSNEDSTALTFQRTMSAQDTLAEATALLTEIEAQEAATEMDVTGSGSKSDEPSSPVFTTEPCDEPDSSEKPM
jgi:ubiquitin carboxyl-terminal hydrolase 9/24